VSSELGFQDGKLHSKKKTFGKKFSAPGGRLTDARVSGDSIRSGRTSEQSGWKEDTLISLINGSKQPNAVKYLTATAKPKPSQSSLAKASKKKGLSVSVRESSDSATNTEPAMVHMFSVKQTEKPKPDNDNWPYTSTHHRQEPFEISVEIKASTKKDKTM